MGKDLDFMRSNMQTLCRTCYQVSAHLHSLHERTEQFPLKSLADLLMDIAKIDTKATTSVEEMPEQMCGGCSRKLKNAYSFVLRAQEVNDRLLQYTNSSSGDADEPKLHLESKHLDCLLEAPIDIPTNVSEYLQIKLEDDCIEESIFDTFSLPDQIDDDNELENVEHDMEKLKKLCEDFEDEDDDSLANMKRKSRGARKGDSAVSKRNKQLSGLQLKKENTDNADPITVSVPKRKLRSCKHDTDYESEQNSESDGEWNEKPKRRRGRPLIHKAKPNVKGRYSCDVCGKTFAWKKDLSRHAASHNLAAATFECNVCARQFTRKDKLKDHQKVHQRNSNDDGRCTVSGRARHPEWNFAERLYSQQKFKKIECKLCNINLESTHLLRAHLPIHTNADTLQHMTLQSVVSKELFAQAHNLDEIKAQISREIAEQHYAKYYAVVNENGYELCLSDSDADADEDDGNAKEIQHKYNCELCQQTFGRKFHVFEHLKMKHAFEKIPYKCNVCKMEFVCREMFDVHTRTQCRNKEKKYQCLKCPGKFMWVENLDQHNCSNRFNSAEYKAQLPKKRELLKCTVCDMTFVWRKDLKRHKETHEPDGSSHECSICYQRFLKADNLRQHLKQAHEQLRRRRIECCLCGVKFAQLQELRDHLPQHADGYSALNKEQGSFFSSYSEQLLGDEQAAELAQLISNDFALQNTSRFYSAVDESGNELDLNDSESDEDEDKQDVVNKIPLYKCVICEQTFTRRKRIFLHQNAEHAEVVPLPYECAQCSKQFVCAELLQHHLNRDHNNAYKQWQCNKCTARFVWQQNLEAHLNIKHIDPEQQISRRLANKLQCDECDKTFIWPKDLNRHKRCHLPEDEKYECPYCTRRFNRKDNMQAHMKIHGTQLGVSLSLSTKREHVKHAKVKALNEHLCKPHGCKLIQCMLCFSKHSKIADLRTHLRTHSYVVSLAPHRPDDVDDISLKFYPDEEPMQEEQQLIARIIDDITSQRLERFYSITNEVGYELNISDSETDSDSEVEEETVRQTYECELCCETFRRKYKLYAHQQHAHEWTDVPHSCEVCDARFLCDALLQQHYKTQCKNAQKRFVCKKCPLRFMWKDNLKMHERTLHPELEESKKKQFEANRLQCTECQRTFAWQKDLTRHMMQHQPESELFKCMWCPRKFHRKDNLHAHIKKHGVTPKCLATAESHISASSGPHGRKHIYCKVCNIQFSSINTLRTHLLHNSYDQSMAIALKPEPNALAHHAFQSMLNYSIINELGFELQLDDSESEGEGLPAPKAEGMPLKYTCEICQMEFIRKYEIAQHQRTVHQYEQMPKKCDKCPFKTVSKDILDHHTRTQCYNLEKQLQCSICSFKFMWQENLDNHIQRMHPQDQIPKSEDKQSTKSSEAAGKPYQCDMCPCKYNRKDRLTAHIRKVHVDGAGGGGADGDKANDASLIDPVTGEQMKKPPPPQLEKKYLCAFCGRAVTSSSNLIIHMRRHTGEKPFKCDFCDMAFPRSSDLQCHRRTHTGEKPHKCTVCDKAFSRSYKLQTHMRIHSGERPYKCTYCEKSFTQSNDLTLHIRRHTGERPYVCGICGERFIQGTALKNHRTMRGHYEDVEPRKLTVLERF